MQLLRSDGTFMIPRLTSLSPGLPKSLVVALTEVPASLARSRSGGRRRRQRNVGRNLACEAAARLNDCHAVEFQVAGGGDSRPVMATYPAHARDTTIAITHSGSWICAAASHGQAGLGIDVQMLEGRDVVRLAEFLNWTGLMGASADNPQTQQDKFTHLWTLWEAAVKCDGTTVFAGTTPAFESLAPRCHPGTEQSWSAGGYWARSGRLDERHWLTLVASCPTPPSLEFHYVARMATLARQA